MGCCHMKNHKKISIILHKSEGVLTKGPSIRENYQPITGDGVE